MVQPMLILTLLYASSLCEGLTSSITEDTIEDKLIDAVARIDCLQDELERFKIDRHDCGNVNRFEKIVGGQTTEVNEYPWQAALVRKNTKEVFCGGSVINQQWIITAAHCDFNIRNHQILLGNHHIQIEDESEIRLDVIEVFEHPDYNAATKNSDISLLKLQQPLRLNNVISPVCLPRMTRSFDDVSSIVTGWGRTSSGGQQPNELQEANVQTMDNNKCNLKYSRREILASMICAASTGRDTCQGDSGGPLVTEVCGRNYLIGITSFGIGCANPSYPGVYARVTDALKWITETTSSSINVVQTDPELCRYVDVNKCGEANIAAQCINLCSPKITDSEMCTHIDSEKCHLSFVKTNCPATCNQPDMGCSSPWISVDTQCFLPVTTEKQSWSSARAFCQGSGADLAEPQDVLALIESLKTNGYPTGWDYYWLGASDASREGSWVWLNGTVLPHDHSNWHPGQPNDADDGQHCLYMHPALSAGSLGDESCDRARYFICGRPAP